MRADDRPVCALCDTRQGILVAHLESGRRVWLHLACVPLYWAAGGTPTPITHPPFDPWFGVNRRAERPGQHLKADHPSAERHR